MIAVVFAMLLSVQHALDSSATLLDKFGAVVCSGFVVQNDPLRESIATAKHCTTEVLPAAIQYYDGDTATISGIRRSKKADVAVLSVHPKHEHPAVTFSNDVSLGDPAFLIGSASGDPWSYASLHSRNGSQVVQTDKGPVLSFEGAGVYFGDSGAAIFDANDNVIAVLDSGFDEERPNIVFAAPVSCVADILDGK